jgi:hypothetical protein
MAAHKTFRHLVSTAPTPVECRCGAQVLSCLVNGTRRRIDPAHLNALGEAMALVAGAATFECSVLGGSAMTRRNVTLIRDGVSHWRYVHPEHRCGVSWDHEQYLDGREVFGVAYTGVVPPF